MTKPARRASPGRFRLSRATGAAAIYAVFGFLWILLSDRALETLTTDVDELGILQTYKGWFFIVITALLVYGLVRRSVSREALVNARLQEQEAEARARFYELSHIFRYSPIGLLVLDTDLRYVRINDNLAAINGVPARDHIGKTVHEVLPDVADQLTEVWRPILEGGEPVFDVEVSGHTPKNPDDFRTWLCSYIPMKDDDGVVIGLIGAVLDITERKAAEQAMRLSELILEHLPDAAIIADLNPPVYTIRGWHGRAESMLGYKAEEVLGESAALIRHPHMSEDFVAEFGRRVESEGAFHGEMIFKHKDGRAVPVLMSSRVVVDSGGRPSQIVAVLKDLTEVHQSALERRQLEAQIQQAQKMESLGLLAGGIAHDFNNLLLGILGNADLALMEMAPSALGRPHVGAIVSSAQRAAELCNQLLAYSGRGRFVIQSVDVAELVREMSHLLEISISKKICLQIRTAENAPPIEGDVTQMRQVVMNLITNASDAIGDATGTITLRTGTQECDRDYLKSAYLRDELSEGLYVYLEVSDTGPGMDRDTQARIFDPFFTTKEKGHGLGLSAVLGIIRGHGGTIKVYSELGKGTTFKVLFPCSERPAEAIAPAPTGTQHGSFTGTVLVADDEAAVRELTKSILERAGFDVILALDGREALDIFERRQEELCLVLLDMTMPRLSGEETFREMRLRAPKLPIILSSGYNEQEVTSSFVGKGLSGFIQKPYRAQALIDLVHTTLEHASHNRDG